MGRFDHIEPSPGLPAEGLNGQELLEEEPNSTFDFEGDHRIYFTNGSHRNIILAGVLVDTNNRIFGFHSASGEIINWDNILYMEKSDV